MLAILKKHPRSNPAPLARPEPPVLTPGTPEPLPREIRVALRQVARRQLRVQWIQCAAALVGTLPGLWLLQALADRAFALPWSLRLLLLTADVVVLCGILHRFGWVPFRERLNPETAALLVERKLPIFRSGLISAVQLSAGTPGWPQGSLPLVKVLVRRVATMVKSLHIAPKVVSSAVAKKWTLWALLPLALFAAGWGFFPQSAAILGQRILLSKIQLPTLTQVVAVTKDLTVNVGSDLTLSAQALGVLPNTGRAVIVYDSSGNETLSAPPMHGSTDHFAITLTNLQQSFRYHFLLNDGEGAEYRVSVLQPPAIAACRFVQVYPAYTGLAPAEMSSGNLSLLAGSHLKIEARSSLPLRSAAVRFEGGKDASPLAIGPDKRVFKGDFPVPKTGMSGFSFELLSTDGATSTENTVYRVDFVPDTPPKVELTEPMAERTSISPRSKPALSFTAMDDFGITKMALRYELTRPSAPGAESAKPETGSIPLPNRPAGGAWNLDWDPARKIPGFSVGCSLRYWIEATDNNNVTGPGVGASARKTLVLVSEEQKKAELLQALGSKADDIQRIYDGQKKITTELDGAIRNTP